MDFKNLSEKELLQAYRGYRKVMETGAVGENDFDGIFRKAIDEQSGSVGLHLPMASANLLAEMAERWYNEHQFVDTMLTVGTELWYVDEDTGEIERAVVATVSYKDGKLDSFSAEFPESDDFDEFYGHAFGSCFFSSETQAKMKLAKGFQNRDA